MSLKFRYATFLFLILVLLAAFALGIVYFLNEKKYFIIAVLCILLYLTTFLIGRRFSAIFFTLSTLKFIRKNNGVVSTGSYFVFIQSLVRSGKKNHQIIGDEILQKLLDENVVELRDDNIYLIQ